MEPMTGARAEKNRKLVKRRAYDVIWPGIVPSDGQNTTDGAEGFAATWLARAGMRDPALSWSGATQRLRAHVPGSSKAKQHNISQADAGWCEQRQISDAHSHAHAASVASWPPWCLRPPFLGLRLVSIGCISLRLSV